VQYDIYIYVIRRLKVKGPEGSRRLRLPDF
jgi:hypothetical protein